MIKAIIIDDEPKGRENLRILINKYCATAIEVIAECSDIETAYHQISALKPQLVFLDIELGNATGFDLLQKFKILGFKVIFVTAYDQYAVKAIKFCALDYLLKPIQADELVQAVKRAMDILNTGQQKRVDNMFQIMQKPLNSRNRIALPTEKGYELISVEEILYCEANKEYTNIYRQKGVPFCSSVNLGEYEELLTDYSFFRVHHSYIVNKQHIFSYQKEGGGEIIMDNKTVIPVSRRKKTEFLEWLTHK